MSIKNLKVIKKPRDDPLPDIPISFPQFDNLHLELLEAKEKLKKGLPLIPRSKPIMKPKVDIQPSKPSIPIIIPIRQQPAKTKENFTPIKKKPHVVIDISSKSARPDEVIQGLASDSESEELAESSSSEESPKVKSKTHDNENKIEEEPSQDDLPILEDEVDIYAGLSPEERAAKEKEEYLWRFRILKKQYGRSASIPIPEWSEHSELGMMKTSYERTIKELYLDDAVETYRTYLLGGWIVMEYVCTQMIGIDLRGFTVQQTRMMYKYDRMLIELGEKSYTRWGMNLPVEVRLIGMILFQAAIFYLGKIISDKLGSSVAELFKGFTGQPPEAEKNPETNPPRSQEDVFDNPKQKMKGPKLSAEKIRERNKT